MKKVCIILLCATSYIAAWPIEKSATGIGRSVDIVQAGVANLTAIIDFLESSAEHEKMDQGQLDEFVAVVHRSINDINAMTDGKSVQLFIRKALGKLQRANRKR